jgi:hypothetical protein
MPRIKCPGCRKDWGHSYCGDCGGEGTIWVARVPIVDSIIKLVSYGWVKSDILNWVRINHRDWLPDFSEVYAEATTR